MEELKAFKDLTPAEQGVILLAIHNGITVEVSRHNLEWIVVTSLCVASKLGSDVRVRIKPVARVRYIDMCTCKMYSTKVHDNCVKFIECMEGE